jgi:hypothetical protein
MSRRRRAVTALIIAVAAAVLLGLHLQRLQQQRLRMDFCLRTQASCMGASLGQEQTLIDLLAKPGRTKADRAAALALLRGLRDCWSYAGDLAGQAPEDGFFVPLHQAEIWVSQSVQVGDDAIHLDPRRDASVLHMALAGLRGNLVEQRRNLLAFADACRELPWDPARARALAQWAQSLQPRR